MQTLLAINGVVDKITSYQWDIYLAMIQILITFMMSSFLVLSLIDSKYNEQITKRLIGGYMLLMCLVNACGILLNIGRFEVFCQFTIITFAILLVIMSLVISRLSIAKTLFGALVCISFIAMMMEFAMFFIELFDHNVWKSTAYFIVYTIEMFFMVRFVKKVFKPYFIYTFREFPKYLGWYLFIPLAHIFVHCLYFLETVSKTWRVYLNMSLINLIVILAYSLMFYSINFMRKEEREATSLKIYKTQVEMLASQINTSREMDNELKIIRHDMKHYVGTMKSFFDNGEIEKAKEYIGYINSNVVAIEKEQYCKNVIVNACVGYYIKNAKESKIKLTHRLNIDDNATKNDIEFSTVIANAMENAINACNAIKTNKERSIDISINTKEDKLVVKIANTYNGMVKFDENHLPITSGGIGVSSIMSYVNQNEANVQFSIRDGKFVFIMVLSQ